MWTNLAKSSLDVNKIYFGTKSHLAVNIQSLRAISHTTEMKFIYGKNGNVSMIIMLFMNNQHLSLLRFLPESV